MISVIIMGSKSYKSIGNPKVELKIISKLPPVKREALFYPDG